MKNFYPQSIQVSAWAFIFLMPGLLWAQAALPHTPPPTRENTTPIDLPKVKRIKKTPSAFIRKNDPGDVMRINTVPADPSSVDTPGTPQPGLSVGSPPASTGR